MDMDGVLRGDQGKNRKPHDHNRDYIKESYPSVAAFKRWAAAWGAKGIQAGLDFHCPYIRGRRDECIHFVYAKDSKLSANLDEFCRGLESELPFDPADMLPFGDDLNQLSSGASCQEWMDRLPGMRLASTVEFPYAMVKNKVVSVESAHAFGRDLARALEAYLS
jgi:hypothetical protein